MLHEFALPELDRLFDGDDGGMENLIFMQDGATPHFGGLALLDEYFNNRWMGRGTRRYPSPYPWPPRSPDLTVMDFFLWGYLKSKLYTGTNYGSLQELREATKNEIRAVPIDMIQRSIREGYVNRLRECVARGGRQVETY